MKQKKTNSNPLVKALKKKQGDNPLIDLMEMMVNVHAKMAVITAIIDGEFDDEFE